jgi:hypothetical protein
MFDEVWLTKVQNGKQGENKDLGTANAEAMVEAAAAETK